MASSRSGSVSKREIARAPPSELARPRPRAMKRYAARQPGDSIEATAGSEKPRAL
jgi:hypothetical protein